MSIPEEVLWAFDDNGEDCNHVYVECPLEKRELFKELFAEEYTSEKISEMTSLVDNHKVLLDGNEFCHVTKEGNSYSDIVLTENGFSWTFDPHILDNYKILIQPTNDGFLISWGTPVYLIGDGIMVGYSHAIHSTLDFIKSKIPEIEYDGCEGYCWSDRHGGESVYNEFSSRKKNNSEKNIYDYVGKILNSLLHDEYFVDSFRKRLEENGCDPKELLDFFNLYRRYIDEECICNISKILIPASINEDDYETIKTISEWKNAITEENILEFIEFASENVDEGGEEQIVEFLLEYKNKHFPNIECSVGDVNDDEDDDEDDDDK